MAVEEPGVARQLVVVEYSPPDGEISTAPRAILKSLRQCASCPQYLLEDAVLARVAQILRSVDRAIEQEAFAMRLNHGPAIAEQQA